MTDEQYLKLKAVKDAYHPEAMRIPGVHATSIGFKTVGRETTKTIALRVHVEKKRSIDELSEAERIPNTIGGFPVDVVEDEIPSPYADTAEYRPLVGGIQIQEVANEYFGTLGCIVRDNFTGLPGALSNHHVLNRTDHSIFPPKACQPKVDDCNVVGDVLRSILSSNVDGAFCNLLDVNTDPKWRPHIVQIGDITGTYNVTIHDVNKSRVMKRGRTTELTQGIIMGIDRSGRSTNGWNYVDQIEVLGQFNEGSFIEPGDSGSVAIHIDEKDPTDLRVAGLLWGGNTTFNRGIMSPIQLVLDQLDVSVLTKADVEAPVPFEETMAGKLEALLTQSCRGQGYLDSMKQHRSSIIHLFHGTPRLYAIWKGTNRRELMDAIRVGIDDPDSAIPAMLGTRKTIDVLAKLRDGMSRYFDDELMEQVDLLCQDISKNIGSSWRDAFRG